MKKSRQRSGKGLTTKEDHDKISQGKPCLGNKEG